jgi:hypothetical protein
MCAKAAPPPTPQAPPAPTPVRDTKIDATRERQSAARRASSSGYAATMLTGSGGVQGSAPTASPVLGG